MIKLIAVTLISSLLVTNAYAEKKELNLLIWSDYIHPEVVTEFEKKWDVTLKQNFFISDDDRDDILQNNNAQGHDLVLVNGASLSSYIKHGWLAPIPKNELPNKKHIDPHFMRMIPGSEAYAIPYFWGTLGIAYREDLITTPITSWKQLFQPSQELQHKIVMLGSARDLVGMALKANGYSANSESKDELNAAAELIQAQAPYVKSYSYISLQESSGLVTGNIVAAMAFSGDAVALKEHNANILYVVPKEGGNVWLDYIAVLSESPEKELAIEFINFLNEPKIAARQAEYLYYPTPNKSAEKYISKEFLQNSEIYPTKAILDNSEIHQPLSPRAMKKRHEIFSRTTK